MEAPKTNSESGGPAHLDTSADTIAAISTPPGRGGIGIVRLSGPRAAAIGARLALLRHPLEHGRARLADVVDEDAGVDAGRIDDAVVTLFAAPHSECRDRVIGWSPKSQNRDLIA